jgi:hypothetical protein
MKQIQPVMVWSSGQELEANGLNAYVVSDNLLNQAVFYYGVGTIVYNLYPALPSVNALSAGQLTMTGQDYINWQTNLYAWDWVAAQLNLTIVGDITTTSTSTTTTEAPVTSTTTLL